MAFGGPDFDDEIALPGGRRTADQHRCDSHAERTRAIRVRAARDSALEVLVELQLIRVSTVRLL
jgi:hypothetical protein